MKVLFIKSGIHRKNLNFILNCKKIEFTIVNHVNDIDNLNISDYDAVYSPCEPIDISKYPNTKFIFGPQFSVFPDVKLMYIKSDKSAFNLLSDWVINIWSKFALCDNLRLVKLPFGVDTEIFTDNKPNTERTNVIVYFKHRNPLDLHIIENFLIQKSITYTVFSYDNRYVEQDYINNLQNSKYCIWVDAHESQGFALQEALSCNVPLLVWGVTYMSQEYGQNYENFLATTTSYWDEKCGEIFYNADELETTFNKFINNIENYKPREFILENLSVDACENRLINFIENM